MRTGQTLENQMDQPKSTWAGSRKGSRYAVPDLVGSTAPRSSAIVQDLHDRGVRICQPTFGTQCK